MRKKEKENDEKITEKSVERTPMTFWFFFALRELSLCVLMQMCVRFFF